MHKTTKISSRQADPDDRGVGGSPGKTTFSSGPRGGTEQKCELFNDNQVLRLPIGFAPKFAHAKAFSAG